MQASKSITEVINSLGEFSQFFSFGIIGREPSESKVVVKAQTVQQVASLCELLKKNHISWMEEDGILKEHEHGEYANTLRGCSLNAK